MGKVKFSSFYKKYWAFICLGIIVSFFYTVNLDKNSRFVWDESRALVDMHRIWEKKEITFVGPISEDNLEMFPSLSYYMYLPGAVLTKFDPLGPVYVAVFLGLLSWLILTVTIIGNLGLGQKSILISLLYGILNPVLVSSRWAWNPNPVIFWMTVFISSLFYENPWILFIGGLSLGASLYHHYLAALGAIPALIFLPIFFDDKKHILRRISLIFVGFIVSVIPFTLFELKNHYYLNSGTFLSGNQKSFISLSFRGFFDRSWNSISTFSTMFVPDNIYIISTFIGVLLVIFISYRNDRIIRYSFSSLLTSIFLFGFVTKTYPHYQYALVSLFILFLFGFLLINKNILSKLLIVILLVFSITKGISTVNSYTWEGDIVAVRNTTHLLLSEKQSGTNIAVLQSNDPNTKGQRYRDMALINGLVLDPYDRYPKSEVLFIISENANQKEVLQDNAWEIQTFKDGTITNVWKVSNYPEYLFRLEKRK